MSALARECCEELLTKMRAHKAMHMPKELPKMDMNPKGIQASGPMPTQASTAYTPPINKPVRRPAVTTTNTQRVPDIQGAIVGGHSVSAPVSMATTLRTSISSMTNPLKGFGTQVKGVGLAAVLGLGLSSGIAHNAIRDVGAISASIGHSAQTLMTHASAEIKASSVASKLRTTVYTPPSLNIMAAQDMADATGKPFINSLGGELQQFSPREKVGGLIQLGGGIGADGKGGLSSVGNVHYSSVKNIAVAPVDYFKGKSADSIYSEISKANRFNPNLPIEMITSGIEPKTMQQLAEKAQVPVRVFNDSNAFHFREKGLEMAFKNANESKAERDPGTVYTPKNYHIPVPTNLSKETPWMDVGMSQLGVRENGVSKIIDEDGRVEGSNRGFEVDQYAKAANAPSGNYWCASYLSWVMKNAGMDTKNISNQKSSLAWSKYGDKINKPAYGAVAVRNDGEGHGHVGFVAGVDSKDPSRIMIMGGNQDDDVSYMWDKADRYKFTYPKGHTPDYNVPKYDGSKMVQQSNIETFYDLPQYKVIGKTK